jgi:hypothetical protein
MEKKMRSKRFVMDKIVDNTDAWILPSTIQGWSASMARIPSALE